MSICWWAVIDDYEDLVIVEEGATTSTLKLRSSWTPDEINLSGYNIKGLNVIYSETPLEEFQRISMCKIVKEA